MAGIIIKPGRTYPVFGGSLPSRSGGRRTLVLSSISQDGEWKVEAEDQGPEEGTNDPILFVPFGAVDYALTKEDLREMVAGMRERHQRWREKQPPPPDFNKLVREWLEVLKARLRGRQQFYFERTIGK